MLMDIRSTELTSLRLDDMVVREVCHFFIKKTSKKRVFKHKKATSFGRNFRFFTFWDAISVAIWRKTLKSTLKKDVFLKLVFSCFWSKRGYFHVLEVYKNINKQSRPLFVVFICLFWEVFKRFSQLP